MTRSMKYAAMGLLVAILAALGGAAVLLLHPRTAPDFRGYLRDRYLRPRTPLPRL